MFEVEQTNYCGNVRITGDCGADNCGKVRTDENCGADDCVNERTNEDCEQTIVGRGGQRRVKKLTRVVEQTIVDM